ncbi:Fic family protein [Acinetobacter tibetensis]|uniref:Fic family protein n=1 Tax=Acinetobacter tibetensis TaxID=2943497 RepID=UPI003A4E24D2
MDITPIARVYSPELEEKLLKIARLDAQLDATVPVTIRESVEDLLRVVNSYYSNKIEGNPTKPSELIALVDDSTEQKSKGILEIKRHIEVQVKLNFENTPLQGVATQDFIKSIHKAFYAECSPDELIVSNSDGSRTYEIEPGEYRNVDVVVGQHIPPKSDLVPTYMSWFANAYKVEYLHGLSKYYAMAASHHRLAWIHPFLDGNGRVTRLFTDCFMRAIGLKSYGLWSMSRGFARSSEQYYRYLAIADRTRQGGDDGRGILSDAGLVSFTEYFMDVAIDQMTYFTSLLEPYKLEERINVYFQLRFNGSLFDGKGKPLKKLSLEAKDIYKTLLYNGPHTRKELQDKLQVSERKLRDIITEMAKDHLIFAPPKRPLQVRLSPHTVEVLFPYLFQ